VGYRNPLFSTIADQLSNNKMSKRKKTFLIYSSFGEHWFVQRIKITIPDQRSPKVKAITLKFPSFNKAITAKLLVRK
jgi:hypothetical protein